MLFAEFTESENCGFGPVTTVPPLFSDPVYEVCIETVVSGGENADATNTGDALTKTINTARNTLFLAVNRSPQSRSQDIHRKSQPRERQNEKGKKDKIELTLNRNFRLKAEFLVVRHPHL